MPSTNSPIDALLVHCYWFDHNSKNQLDSHGNLQLLATSYLLKNLKIRKVVILGGRIDPDRESIGLAMSRALSKKLNKKLARKVLVVPNSLTTRQEVREFEKLMKEYCWYSIATLALGTHIPRVKRTFKRIFAEKYGQLKFITTEKVLNQHGFKKEIVKYTKSPDLKSLKINEALVGTVDSIPLVGGHLIDLMIKIFPRKGVFLSKIYSITKSEVKKI